MKSTYWKDLGYPGGMYRVGPLARLNVIDQFGTAEADDELDQYRERAGALPVELVLLPPRPPYRDPRRHQLHRGEPVATPRSSTTASRAVAEPNRSEGVGVSEAPRGTLMHHYRVDANGSVEWANLVIATGHNNLAMNKGVLEVARKYVHGTQIPEPMLNRVEAVIRCFDPCLSCSTHAIGEMPLELAAHRGGRTGPRRAG